MTVSRDLVNHKKWSRYKIDARNGKIVMKLVRKPIKFKATDIYVRDFTVILTQLLERPIFTLDATRSFVIVLNPDWSTIFAAPVRAVESKKYRYSPDRRVLYQGILTS